MTENVVQNAIQYKIDGFRFDDMSLHFAYNMRHIQQALRSLTLADDGVDGSKIYLYGEGFLNSETAALGVNATQQNLYGYGFGTFNDRIRDGIVPEPSSFILTLTSVMASFAVLALRGQRI